MLMHGGYLLVCNMHETLLPCMNHDWFMHREIKHTCFKEIGIIHAYNMHLTGIQELEAAAW